MSQHGKPKPRGTSQPQSDPRGYRFFFVTVLSAVVLAIGFLWRASHHTGTPAQTSDRIPQAAAPPGSTPAAPAAKNLLRSILPRVAEPPASGPALAQLIAQLLDPNQSLAIRRTAARTLAKNGSATAMQALKSVLQEDGPAALKAAVAETLGECPAAEARQLLLTLANGADETTARGAMRGLATCGDAGATEVLAAAMFDEKKSAGLRTEAALALGSVQQPAALDALTRAVHDIKDETILECVLDGLGHHPFAETEATFREFLKRDDLSTDSRVAAIEALGHTPDIATSFLLDQAGDPNQEVRAAVGWALTSADNPGEIRMQLLDWLQQESDPSVRLRLYQALSHQKTITSSTILPLVQRETDAEARLAGLGLLADALRADGSADASLYFESTAIAELKNTVISSGRLDQSLAAIMALDRAGTPAAVAALNEIAQNTTDPAFRAAAQQALKRNSRK